MNLRHLQLCIGFSSALAMLFAGNTEAQPWRDIGRPATSAEVKAWDIDVRADFTGLPKGSGSVAKGEVVWEGKCASCHGSFGELNEVFPPIVGGTTARDMVTGHAAGLTDNISPHRTTLMKLAKLSTLWDYINRAMPWTAPKTMSHDEVYASVAYILHLGGIVPADFTLSNENIAEVQKKLPNRNGLVNFPGLWETRGKADVTNIACMNNCVTEQKISSSLPDYARNAHGNIAEQNRPIGAFRGVDTTTAENPAPLKAQAMSPVNTSAVKSLPVAVANSKIVAAAPASSATALNALKTNGCLACHGMKNKIVGPGFTDIAGKHKSKSDAEKYFADRIKNGGSGVWGAIPMPAQPQLKDVDVQAIATWITNGAR